MKKESQPASTAGQQPNKPESCSQFMGLKPEVIHRPQAEPGFELVGPRETRRVVLNLRISDREFQNLQEKAGALGLSVSELVRRSIGCSP